jgi:Na+/melibiose symporter-like transporter
MVKVHNLLVSRMAQSESSHFKTYWWKQFSEIRVPPYQIRFSLSSSAVAVARLYRSTCSTNETTNKHFENSKKNLASLTKVGSLLRCCCSTVLSSIVSDDMSSVTKFWLQYCLRSQSMQGRLQHSSTIPRFCRLFVVDELSSRVAKPPYFEQM